MATKSRGNRKLPWTMTQVFIVSFLFGPVAAGLITGVNYKRLEKPKKLMLCFLIGIALFIIEIVFIRVFYDLNMALTIFAFHFIPALLFMKTQEPLFETWEMENWEYVDIDGSYHSSGVGGLIFLGIFIGVIQFAFMRPFVFNEMNFDREKLVKEEKDKSIEEDYEYDEDLIGIGFEEKTFTGHESYIQTVCYSPDGDFALSASSDYTLKLWDIESGDEIRTFSGHTDYVWAACFSYDGEYILSCAEDGSLYLWDTEEGIILRELAGHDSAVYDVVCSKDSEIAVSAGKDSKIKIWNIETGEMLKEINDDSDYWIYQICLSPDSKQILSVGGTTFDLWDANTGEILHRFYTNGQIVSRACFSPDGNYILSACYGQVPQLWDARSYTEIMSFSDTLETVNTVDISPDNRYALASDGSALLLLDMYSGETLDIMDEHEGNIQSAHFSPYDNHILSGSADGTMKLWTIE